MHREITPMQPYLAAQAKELQKLTLQNAEISHCYQFKVGKGQAGEFCAVPDGSTDLVFSIGQRDVKVFIGGTVLRAKQWQFEEGRTHFGIRFRAGKNVLPQGITIRDVVNADLELDQAEYGETAEKIAYAKDIRQRAEIFIEYCRKKQQVWQEFDSARAIEQFVRKKIYENRGNITIHEIGEESGYSECYVRRSFQGFHGISPKVFARFVRFQYMLELIGREGKQVDLEQLGLACGYYDQSHMTREFKAFAGMAPESYRNYICNKPGRAWQ